MKKLISRKPRVSVPKISVKKFKNLFTYKRAISTVLVLSLALFAVSGATYWYRNVLTDPDKILSDMVDKSLQAGSVYRTVDQQSGQSSVKQDVFVKFSPEVLSESVTNLQEFNDLGRTRVTTESIGTAQTDLIRYTAISIEGNPNTKRNFDNILNAWGRRDVNEQTGESTSFLNDALFVIVPFGNLNPSQRAEMQETIKKANLYNYSDYKIEKVDGRRVVTYAIDLDPQALVTVLAKYVELTGVGQGAELNPASYEGAEKIRVNLTVDLLSRHVQSIDFADSGRKETYGSYNVTRDITLPKETIDINELQTRLQTIQ